MAINWKSLYTTYKGRWIALKDDEQTVIASGETAKNTLIKAQKHGYKNPILTKMPKKLLAYVGSV